jgi:hypothetical protein
VLLWPIAGRSRKALLSSVEGPVRSFAGAAPAPHGKKRPGLRISTNSDPNLSPRLAFRANIGIMRQGGNQMQKQRLRMICERCGSTQVTRDAWAEWREEAQEWVLGMVFDHAFCHACEKKTRVAERPLEE